MNGSVKGMETTNKELEAKYGKDKNYYVPVKTLFWSFGSWLVATFCSSCCGVLGLWFSRKKKGYVARSAVVIVHSRFCSVAAVYH